MKNGLKLLIGVIVIILGIILLKSKNSNPLIEKNKQKIIKIESTQDSLFEVADSIISNISKNKNKKNQLIEDLNGELDNKSSRLRHTQSTLNNNLFKIKAMENVCMGHLTVIDSINKSLAEKSHQIKLLIDSLNTQKEVIHLMKLSISTKSYMVEEYEKKSHIVTDTIYQIDTIFYPKNKIKVLKLKK